MSEIYSVRINLKFGESCFAHEKRLNYRRFEAMSTEGGIIRNIHVIDFYNIEISLLAVRGEIST